MAGKIYIGTSGFYYAHWIGKFYPEDLRREEVLSFYSQHFETVEINSSFYHFPRRSTVEKWKAAVSGDFVFSLKLHRSITHLRKLKPEVLFLDKFFASLEPLKRRKTVVLIQTPGSLKCDLERLQVFLSLIPKGFLYAFEFRHKSWFEREVYELLKKEAAALVFSDSPIKKDGSRLWPRVEVETAPFFYIRLHGSKSLYRSSYERSELEEIASLAKEKAKAGLDVFVYFNNDAEGHAIENALELKGIVET